MTTDNYQIEQLKPLTLDQYEQCREKAFKRVQQRIGDRPTRNDFKRELAPLWTVLDLIALAVFTAALIVSSVHIIAHMGKLATASYQAISQSNAGTIISQDFYVAIHQWGFIALSEGAMILFLVMFGLTKTGWRRWVYLTLSLAALVFVFVANWQSGIGVLESVLAPVFTVGIGLKLEQLIVLSLKRRNDIENRYLAALAVYEASNQDASKHPDYIPLFKQEIWQKLVGLGTNKDFRDAPPAFKIVAVNREMERDSWAYELAHDHAPAHSPIAISTDSNGHKEPEDFLTLATAANGHRKRE